MFNQKPHQSIFILLVSALVLFACSTIAPATPTPTATVPPATNTPLPSPTATHTAKPTLTPRPSATPNVVATEMYDEIFSTVQKFNEEGLIQSTKGTYRILEDFDEHMAQIGWLRFMYFPLTVKHFVFHANIRWQTAIDTTDTSGCGIVFGVEEKSNNYEYYGVVLDKSRIFFSIAKSGYYYELGKTRGTGRLNFGNPAEAELILLVHDNHAYVYVDDNFIGEYTLSASKELRGKFGYGIISGTNKDYGTRCRITDARMWQLTE
jgi:hypothetical protein